MSDEIYLYEYMNHSNDPFEFKDNLIKVFEKFNSKRFQNHIYVLGEFEPGIVVVYLKRKYNEINKYSFDVGFTNYDFNKDYGLNDETEFISLQRIFEDLKIKKALVTSDAYKELEKLIKRTLKGELINCDEEFVIEFNVGIENAVLLVGLYFLIIKELIKNKNAIDNINDMLISF